MNTAEMFLDQVRSVGQGQWNMYMDMEDQSDTVKGASVYYGRDPYDSQDTEKFDSAMSEGMKLRTPTHSHTDGGETQSLDIVDMVYMCRTVLGLGPGTGTNDEELDMAGLCRCPEIEEGEDPPVFSDTVDTGLDRPEQTRHGVIVIPGTNDEELDIAGLCRCPEIEEGEDPLVFSDTVDTGLDRPEQTRHGVIVISNRNRGHDYDYDCELVIVIDYIHGKYNVIAIIIDYFTKVIENHDYISRLHDIFSFIFITVTYIL